MTQNHNHHCISHLKLYVIVCQRKWDKGSKIHEFKGGELRLRDISLVQEAMFPVIIKGCSHTISHHHPHSTAYFVRKCCKLVFYECLLCVNLSHCFSSSVSDFQSSPGGESDFFREHAQTVFGREVSKRSKFKLSLCCNRYSESKSFWCYHKNLLEKKLLISTGLTQTLSSLTPKLGEQSRGALPRVFIMHFCFCFWNLLATGLF